MANQEQLLWCFVYGSNLCRGKMAQAIEGSWSRLQRATAKGFEVTFNKQSQNWRVAANIVPSPRKNCEGVIYRVTERQFRKLKRTEAGYEAMCIEVETKAGERIAARTFVARAHRVTSRQRPKQEYLDFIWYGGLEHGLPRRYLRGLIKKGRGRIPR